jgi:hypothetical protein
MPAKLPPPPDPKSLVFRKTLSIPSLLRMVRCSFSEIPDYRTKKSSYSLPDVLMSGLAVFGLKCPSLLDFDKKRDDKRVRHNLHQLYGVVQAPCDTHLRTILDPVDPVVLRQATVKVIQEVQRQGILESYRFLGGYLVSADGTGLFSSGQISCPECCEKHHRTGETEYYHQLLASVIVHPDKSTVLPLFSEPIIKQDGTTKNDCERNAGKRLYPALNKSFPRLKMIALEDALAANGPHIKTLEDNHFSFIIRVKPDGNVSLMITVQECMIAGKTDEFETKDAKGVLRGYRFVNDVPLNNTHPDIRVNFLEYWEINDKGKQKNFMWITDITLSRDNVYSVMRAGRARWKVENETFNTLKNLGYHFEHNYGHGKQHLATVLGVLTILAFLLDQIQELYCPVFQAARNKFYSRTSLWEKIRGMMEEHYIQDWKSFYLSIIWGHQGGMLQPKYPDTS